MAYSSPSHGSHEALVDILKDGLNSNENIFQDVLHSSAFDDFFSEGFMTTSDSESTEKVRIGTFGVGTYKPHEIEWKVEEGKVFIRGKRSRKTAKGVEGTKFSRVVSVPEEIELSTVTARFSVGDGELIVEGKKKNKTTKKKITKQSSFFSDASYSLSIDLGDGNPLNLNYGSQEGQRDRTVELF